MVRKCKYESILDNDVKKLVGMDINELRKIFLDEVKAIEEMPYYEQFDRLDYVFKKLFRLQGMSYANDFFVSETRLFIDLISTPGLASLSCVRDYLGSYQFSLDTDLNKKQKLLNKIYDFYDNNSDELIDKLNYVLRSSYEIVRTLVGYEELDFNMYFNDRIMNMFDKETLSQVYREYLGNCGNVFRIENHKALYMLAVISKKVKSLLGYNDDFLWVIGNFDLNMGLFLESMYDYLSFAYDDKMDFEREFEKDFLSSDKYFFVEEFINLIMDDSFSKEFFNRCNDFEDFMRYVLDKREEYYHGLNLDINCYGDLENYKDAFFHIYYGISLDKAREFVRYYGSFMNELKNDLDNHDNLVYEVLSSIKNIVDLELDDKEKLSLLLDFDKNNIAISGYMLKGLFNRMCINTYNRKLFSLSDNLDILGYDGGVTLLDAGVDFMMILTSLAGEDDLFDFGHNMASKWNTASSSRTHGLCCSHITNDNLGVICLGSVILGFSHIPEYSLGNMGPSDLFSFNKYYNLRDKDNIKCTGGNKFFPASVMASENRYGYDEILIDRFLLDDKEDKIKLQPDYVVFYKFDDDYSDSSVYMKSLKVAKDFGIPMVVVDVLKIKDHEKKIIKDLEDKLLNSDVCDSSLMKEIVVRYMNNYTGSLCMVYDKSVNYDDEFSVLGMEDFFNRLVSKIEGMSFQDRQDWILALEEVYFDEERKYKSAKNICTYNKSVQNFILKRYNLKEKIKCLKEGLAIDVLENSSKLCTVNFECVSNDINFLVDISGQVNEDNYNYDNAIFRVDGTGERMDVFLSDEDFTPEFRVITDFIGKYFYQDRCGFGSEFGVEDNYALECIDGFLITFNEREDVEEILIENLVVSYFFEDCERMLVDDMIGHDFDFKIDFKCSDDFDFVQEFNDSFVYKRVFDKDLPSYIYLNRNKLGIMLDIIEEIPDKEFLKIFEPVIDNYVYKSNFSSEEIVGNLLDKKWNMRSEFKRLTDYLDKKNDCCYVKK